MTFLDKWKTHFDSLMEYVLVALVGGILLACFSPKIQMRYFIGSVIAGAAAGAIGQALFTSDAAPIGLTILGVLTAPVTIARISGMTLWEAIDKLKSQSNHNSNDG